MKLSTIQFAQPLRAICRLLGENISRTDFFDLYSLIAAHQEKWFGHGDPEHDRQVERRLAFEVERVYRDQLDQLFRIIARRLYEDDENPSYGEGITLRPFYQSWGINTVPDHDTTSPDPESLLQMPLERRAEFLRALVRHREQMGTRQWFTGTDGVWARLALKYGELAGAGTTLEARIRAVDRIYGLVHHGGLLADYFDERDWLEDALHIRSVGSPAQFLRYASSDVRDILRTAGHGSYAPEVTPLQKLSVALNKEIGNHGRVTINGDQLRMTVKFNGFRCTHFLPGIRNQDMSWQRNDQQLDDVSAALGDRLTGTSHIIQKIGGKVEPLGAVTLSCTVRYVNGDVELETGDHKYNAYDMYLHHKQASKPSRVADKIIMVLHDEAQQRFKDAVDQK